MGYFIEGIPEAAETFLRAYEAEAGWEANRLATVRIGGQRAPDDRPGRLVRTSLHGGGLSVNSSRRLGRTVGFSRRLKSAVRRFAGDLSRVAPTSPSLIATSKVIALVADIGLQAMQLRFEFDHQDQRRQDRPTTLFNS